jgi:hypothetical protein
VSLGENLENRARGLYHHAVHPHVAARKAAGPVKVEDQHATGTAATRFNTRLALATTRAVGSMWCAYAFAIFDCLALPQAIRGGMFGIVQWVASFLLQLVLLSIILVGQNVQADAADKRAESTFLDAEAILESAKQIAEHLGVQDGEITAIQAHLLTQDDRLAAIVDQISAVVVRLTSAPPDAAAARHDSP